MSQFTQQPKIGIIAQPVQDCSIELVSLYDDGPITINDVPEGYQNFERVSWYRLKQMIERWPAMKKSWENFIVDYHMCLSTLQQEEDKDDIPF